MQLKCLSLQKIRIDFRISGPHPWPEAVALAVRAHMSTILLLAKSGPKIRFWF